MPANDLMLVNSTQLDADLTDVADAIRAKSGGSSQLLFPSGFISEIESIQTSEYSIDELIDGSITSIVSNVTAIKTNAFSHCTQLTTASFPEATSMGGGGSGVFGGCKLLTSISMPKMAGNIGMYTFNGCEALATVDLASGVTNLVQQSFANCYSLQALILRRTDGVVTIANTAVFSNTPLTGRGGTYSGHVYVPSSLLNSYKTTSNWSALYADYPGIFETIEGSIYE